MAQPDINIDGFIGGAEKGGTSSLAFYLAQHPKVFSHFGPGREGPGAVLEFPSFLAGERLDEETLRRDFLEAYGRGGESGEFVLAKNVDIISNPRAAVALHRFFPHCRLILALRHPVERAYSSFWYQRFRGEESLRDFRSAIEREQGHGGGEVSSHLAYLGRGKYAEHLRVLDGIFGREAIHVVLLEDLNTSPVVTCQDLFRFLGLPSCEVEDSRARNQARVVRSERMARALQEGSAMKGVARRIMGRGLRRSAKNWLRKMNSRRETVPPMDEAMRRELVAYFLPQVEELEDRLGRDLSRWKA